MAVRENNAPRTVGFVSPGIPVVYVCCVCMYSMWYTLKCRWLGRCVQIDVGYWRHEGRDIVHQKAKRTRVMSRKNHMILFVTKYFNSFYASVFGTEFEKAVFT